MNIVFFGSSNFAVPGLKALISSGHNISCVVTQPDREKGRGLSLSSTAVKITAKEAKLQIYQPISINAPEAAAFLQDIHADIFVVVAYGQILSQKILSLPKKMAINIHASLLPDYRGAAPINWAIINGNKNTGVSVMKMAKEMDAGPTMMGKEVPINDNDTAITLEERLSSVAAQLLTDALKKIEDDDYVLIIQDEKRVTFAPKLQKKDGLIHWDKAASSICNLVKGCLPWPGAFTRYHGKLLKIHGAEVVPLARYCVVPLPGEIIEVVKNGIIVVTGKDGLLIKELQIEGKRVMKAEEFIAGHKISIGDKLG